jgi:2-aminoadipate transaminase
MSNPPFAKRMELVQPNAVGELLKFGADSDLMSFAGGYPDGTLFPVNASLKSYQSPA